MVNLDHVSDDDVVEIFQTVLGLIDAGDSIYPSLYDAAVDLEQSCLLALRKGSDNIELANKLQAGSHTRERR